MIDLDKLNTFEHKTNNLTQSQVLKKARYEFEKVFEYTADEVGGRPFDDFFVRGSSRKEVI
jgi:hypothetical protein